MESFLEAWDLICGYCKSQITDVSYDTWFSKLVPIALDFDEGVAIIQASAYTVQLNKKHDKPAGAGEVVTFNINGILYNRKTDSSGNASLNINLPPGKYIVTAEYMGDKVSNTIVVKPVITASDLTKVYGTPDPFVAKLVDGQGRPYSGKTVTFNINGVIYAKTTDSEGLAKLNIALMPGEYIITSTSPNGNSISNKITVTDANRTAKQI
ncbi:MAG: hypothetical protein II230_06160 [Clostridia bacterium]|nr:hypothetical protein [Clostridia bacterium]